MTDRRTTSRNSSGYLLGVECGGTRTVALKTDLTGQLLERREFGAANLRILNDDGLRNHLRGIADWAPEPVAIGMGAAGVREASDCFRAEKVCLEIWRKVPVKVVHDLESAQLACSWDAKRSPDVRVIVLSGTGSCCYGKNSDEESAKVGGWGHMLGDRGSGYDIGFRTLQALIRKLDRENKWDRLGQALLSHLQINEPNDLVDWVQASGKKEIAALSEFVFGQVRRGNVLARQVIQGIAASLADDAVLCAGRLVKDGNGGGVQFVYAGSVLLKQPGLMRKVTGLIRTKFPEADFNRMPREGAWGAVLLARRLLPERLGECDVTGKCLTEDQGVGREGGEWEPSPTEKRNPRSMHLDTMSIQETIDLMLDEDKRMLKAIGKESERIEQLIGWIVDAFKRGGRLFYVGAGTSGRLGVLDASECPPTFRSDPEVVQGIIAGGYRALWQAVEGAEDHPEAGQQAVLCRGVNAKDVVVGIAASGRTPFVHGALRQANRVQAKTALICFNPHVHFEKGDRPDCLICPSIGPEILTGSTRLKSGTATKIILNMLTTLSMVRAGKVIGNLMVDVHPSNVKLRDRAVRILVELTGCDRGKALATLEQSQWVIREAFTKLKVT